MFDNANSDSVERRNIKFPIVCSKLDVKTMPFMLTGLFKKLRNVCGTINESNVITKNTSSMFFSFFGNVSHFQTNVRRTLVSQLMELEFLRLLKQQFKLNLSQAGILTSKLFSQLLQYHQRHPNCRKFAMHS